MVRRPYKCKIKGKQIGEMITVIMRVTDLITSIYTELLLTNMENTNSQF